MCSCLHVAREKLSPEHVKETDSGDRSPSGKGEETMGGRIRLLAALDVPEVATVVTHTDGGTGEVKKPAPCPAELHAEVKLLPKDHKITS